MICGYTYRGVHKKTQQVYIGIRTANIKANRTPEEDFGKYYFTSSKKVRELGFENFNWCITFFVFEKEQAPLIEEDMILDQWIISKELSLNFHCNGKFNNVGREISSETKENISKSLKGREISEKTKEKMSLIAKGRTFSNKTKAKISLANKGMKRSDEAKQKMSLRKKGNKGPKLSEEHKAKISLARKGSKLKTKALEDIEWQWVGNKKEWI